MVPASFPHVALATGFLIEQQSIRWFFRKKKRTEVKKLSNFNI